MNLIFFVAHSACLFVSNNKLHYFFSLTIHNIFVQNNNKTATMNGQHSIPSVVVMAISIWIIYCRSTLWNASITFSRANQLYFTLLHNDTSYFHHFISYIASFTYANLQNILFPLLNPIEIRCNR